MGIVRKFIEFVRNKIITRRGFVPRHNNKDYGKVLAFFPIEHAFNRVGDKYVDITFEFALNDTELLQHEYVVFGEYDLQTINRVTKETGYYGDIYRNVYIERVKDNPRRNEVTPGVGTQ